MLIRFFKASFYMQYLVLILAGAALWMHVYTSPCEMSATDAVSPLYILLMKLNISGSIFFPLLGFTILIFQALLLNYIAIRHELLPKNSMVVAFVYILLMSQSPADLGLNPVLCAALFIIPAFDRILNSYGQADPTKDVFSAAFLLALASLFHFAAIVLIIILLLSFIIFGTFSLRIFFVALAGIFAVYLYLFAYYFLIDNTEGLYCSYILWFSSMQFLNVSYSLLQYLVWALSGMILLMSVFFTLSHINEWNISVRKKMLLIIWFILLAFSTVIWNGIGIHAAILLSAIPLSMMVSGYFTNRKKVPLLLELIFLFWLILTFANNLLSTEC